MDKVFEILKKYVSRDDRLALGVSGGMDSMCLLHFVLHCDFIKRENLTVINIEHGIRGEESISDSEFVKKYCDENRVRVRVVKLDILKDALQSGRSVETEARLQRKNIFDSLLKTHSVDKILLAHHADDQTETILMHIFRGSGIGGLKGMNVFADGYLRPLLTLSRAEIEDYVNKNRVPFVVDSTNTDIRYNRNFVRNEVLPLIKKRWMGVENALLRLSDAAKQQEEYLSSLLDPEFIIKSGEVVFLKLQAFQIPALTPHYIVKALKEWGLKCDFEYRHIEAVMRLKDMQNGKSVCIVHGLKAVKEYDRIAFLKESENAEFCIEFSEGSFVFALGELRISPCECTPKAGKLRIDLDALPAGTVIRSRKEGDVFRPLGCGCKKLKSFLIDKKVPSRLRDMLPLIAYKEQIMVVCGMRISDTVKITQNTKRAVQIDFEPFDEDSEALWLKE